jgi:putative spermidine/putrescine transport system ATP-binding protein
MTAVQRQAPAPAPAAAAAPAVEVRNLRIRYGETPVVRDVSLAVAPGEIVSLLGPSGCGKTTTLRAIGGFLLPEEGDVFLDGRNVTEVPPNRRDIGMVFQGYALFPHLSVFDNVAYGLRMRKVPRAQIRGRVEKALALVKLADLAQRRPKEISGGQQQRVAIARALVIEPKVLLLDEPLSNLDAKLRQEMRVELRRLLKAADVASVFVTHDQEEALVLSDRIVLMNNGQIEQQGSPREIYQQPSTLFAAAFVGQANFLRGTLVDADGGAAVVDVGGTRLRGLPCGELRVGAPATLVVKHERVRLAGDGPARECSADCVFELANFIGANLQLHATMHGQPMVALTPATTAVAPPDRGGPLRVTWDASDALVFPGNGAAG